MVPASLEQFREMGNSPQIPDFGVSTAILNPTEIFRKWYKLNFGLARGYVKSRYFTAILLKG